MTCVGLFWFVHTKEKVAAMSLVGILALMFILPSVSVNAMAFPRYNLTGTWSFNDDGFIHTMMINSFNPITGAFSGIGYYTGDPALTWTITGTEVWNTVNYVLLTGGDTPGVTLTGTGTLTSSTSMSGTGSQSNVGSVVWSATKGTQVVNVNFAVLNDEDSGNNGYWALDAYLEQLQVWQDPNVPTNYYATISTLGLFTTYKGDCSPGAGVVEPKTGFGIVQGNLFGEFSFTGTISSSPPASGFLGIFNYGGTQADLLKCTYGNGQTGNSGPAPYNNFYWWQNVYFPGYTGFTTPSSPSLPGGWSWTYHYGTQVATDAATNTPAFLGDIVT